MLTWMEQHALPFACTTNLPERLDRASLRRFLVKVRFDWLTQAQARLAFQRFFGLTAPAGLDGLRTLTPADFALVRRRAAVTEQAEPRRRCCGCWRPSARAASAAGCRWGSPPGRGSDCDGA